MSRHRDERNKKMCELIGKHVPKTARILEISCGKGQLLKRLQGNGYAVKGTIYSKYPGAADGLDIDDGIDILEGLPYDDKSFDCIVIADVIEHLRDHDKALREASRVCSDHGWLLIMSPNIMKISSRLHFLITGFFKAKRAFIGFDVPFESAFAFHNYTPHLPVFLYQLNSHHFKPQIFDAAGYKPKSLLLWLFFAPVIWMSTYVKTHIKEIHLRNSGVSAFIFKTMTSFPALCGEFWIILANKEEAPAQKITTKLPRWAERHA